MAAVLQNQAAAAPGTAASSHPFTCNTCQVAFRSSDLQRTHMQSDWHRYNLKRRVAALPPLTSETFAEKVLANKASAAATAARAKFEKRCEPCEKTYYSEGAYVNHLGSAKHRLLEAKHLAHRRRMDGMETDSMADSTFTFGETLDTASTQNEDEEDTEREEDSESEEDVRQIAQNLKKADIGASSAQAAVAGTATNSEAKTASRDPDDEDYEHKSDVNQCLFCNYVSPTVDLNVHHMSKQHSFFIPERDYLVDLPGLINYLNETITVLHQCLYCHKAVHTAAGVQTHMRDRGHCMIAYDTEEDQVDVGDFYDFRATYSDDETESDEDDDEPSGGVRLGAKRAVTTTVQNDQGEDVEDDEDEGWESDGSLSSVPTDEIGSVPIERTHSYAKLGLHRHHSHTDKRPHKSSDGFHSHAHPSTRAVYHDDYELHLPTGRTAGHRSLRQYYRQNLRNYPTPEERAQQRMLEAGRHYSDDEGDDAAKASGDRRGRQLVSRADGGLGMLGVSEDKKREVRAVEKRMRKREQRAQARQQWGTDRVGNSQKHYRDPLLQ